MALSTVSRWLRRIGLGKRSRLEPPEPPNRYERKRPGELVHVDVKKLGPDSGRAGHRVTGNRRVHARASAQGRLGAAGWEFCPRLRRRRHPPRLRRGARRRARARPRPAFCAERSPGLRSMGITVERVMSDNGACYRSGVHAAACRELGLRHLRTRPYRPRTNGKAERFIQTLQRPLGLRSHLRHLSRAHRGPTRLAHPLQLHPTSWLPRPPPPAARLAELEQRRVATLQAPLRRPEPRRRSARRGPRGRPRQPPPASPGCRSGRPSRRAARGPRAPRRRAG